MKHYMILFLCFFSLAAGNSDKIIQLNSGSDPGGSATGNDLEINSSNEELVNVFNWAKEKARSFVQTGKKGPVDTSERNEGSGEAVYIPSYWAGYPLRTAFYSRDFCHQLTGAHLLGLEEENFAMMKAFAASADEGKKWFPLWAINFDGSPYKLDYRGNDRFVREVPAVFELVEKAYNLYCWTGDIRYLEDEVMWQYYTKAVTDFISLHDDKIPNGVAEGTGEGIFNGAASYNEQRDYPLIEAGDGIACQFRAFLAYAKIAELRGEKDLSEEFSRKASDLKTYFNREWGTRDTKTYNRGYIISKESVDGWGKENSWFMPMKGITDAGSGRTQRYLDFIDERLESKDDIPDNIEAISYIPEVFFLHHRNELGWKWMKYIMSNIDQEHVQSSLTGKNGDYPEVSYVLIRNVVEDLLGISPKAMENKVSTLSHLPEEIEYLEVENIKIGNSIISVKHEGGHTSRLQFQDGDGKLTWHAGIPGTYTQLFVNGVKKSCFPGEEYGRKYSYCILELKEGDEVVISIE